MTELLTSAQMRNIEQAAIQSGKVTGLELMDHAGRGVVTSIFEEWPELEVVDAPTAAVLCGPGNNGGDGYVIARELEARGWDVRLWSMMPPSEASPDAVVSARSWGGQVTDWAELKDGSIPDLIVDAIFGTGLTRSVPEEIADMFRHLREDWQRRAASEGISLRRVAVDVPTGLSSDTGLILRPREEPRKALSEGWPPFMDWAFDADLTVTFHVPKLGHYLDVGPVVVGKLRIVPLPGVVPCDGPWGLPVSQEGHVRLVAPEIFGRPQNAGQYFNSLGKIGQHKYDHGHALVLSGPPGRGGAARLAARGALRVGAGLVTIGCPMRGMAEHAMHLNAIMVHGLDGTHGLSELLEDKRINALCLGPALGLGPSTADLVLGALQAGRGTVLDADALSRFQRHPQALFDALHENVVLTPHGGEFARLFPDIMEKLTASEEGGVPFSKVGAAREAAARAGCTVLFKGADTVIAAPDGQCSLNAAAYDRQVPWLATAGAGDVLAGMITGLLARGFSAFKAAELGAWLHVEAARAFGPGLIAEDLPETLPRVFREMGL